MPARGGRNQLVGCVGAGAAAPGAGGEEEREGYIGIAHNVYKEYVHQFLTICFVNQQIAWNEANLHYFSRMQLEFDRVNINFFPSKKYIIIIMSRQSS